MTQAGKAGAEIIHRQLHPHLLELVKDDERGLYIAHQHAFRQFQLQALRLHPGFGHDRAEVLDKTRGAKLRRGDVHRDGTGGKALVLPAFGLGAGLPQHPPANGRHQAATFGYRQKSFRGHQAPLRMVPAQQGFSSGQRAGFEMDRGLIEQEEFLPIERVPQAGFDGQSLDHSDVHIAFKKLEIVATFLLGAVHRGIRILDQGFRILTVRGIDTDADAGGHKQLVFVQSVRSGQCCENFIGDRGRIFSKPVLGHQDHEFVAPLPAHRVGSPDTGTQPVGNGLQQCVAGDVAERIVDLLEII